MIGINQTKGFWIDKQWTGKNIGTIEREMKKTKEIEFNNDAIDLIDSLPDYRAWKFK